LVEIKFSFFFFEEVEEEGEEEKKNAKSLYEVVFSSNNIDYIEECFALTGKKERE
jgi:hypothetical protein